MGCNIKDKRPPPDTESVFIKCEQKGDLICVHDEPRLRLAGGPTGHTAPLIWGRGGDQITSDILGLHFLQRHSQLLAKCPFSSLFLWHFGKMSHLASGIVTPLLSTRLSARGFFSESSESLSLSGVRSWCVVAWVCRHPQCGSRANSLLQCSHELVFLKVEGCCFSFSTVGPGQDYPHNEGHLCEPGEFMLSFSRTKIKIFLKCQQSSIIITEKSASLLKTIYLKKKIYLSFSSFQFPPFQQPLIFFWYKESKFFL